MSDVITEPSSDTSVLYICKPTHYLGLRDDVPSKCWGCAHLGCLAKRGGWYLSMCKGGGTDHA